MPFRLAYADFPIADSWVLSFTLVPLAGGPKLPSDPSWLTNDGTEWTVTIPAASSKGITPGRVRCLVLATKAADRRTAEIVTLTVTPNYAEAGDSEYKDQAETLYQAVTAEINARLTGQPAGQAHEANSIAGRAITKIPLLELRQQLVALSVATGRSPMFRTVAEVHRRPSGSPSESAW